jgi:3-oxoadipate enol-lactonase/4-carboxymuconolactone decarboxylase
MPFATAGDARLFFRLDGHVHAPVLLLVSSLGTTHRMWDAAAPFLLERFRLLRLDTRGHGASDAPPGDTTLAQLGGDVLAVMDAAGVGSAAYAGVSLGGMIGQWLALNHPERFSAFVLANTSSDVPRDPWAERIATVRRGGMAALVDTVMGRFFAPATLASGDPVVATTRAAFLDLDPQGYVGCCAAIRDMELGERIAAITAPVLVVNGAEDQSTPPAEHGEIVARRIPGAESVTLPTGHLSPLEEPQKFAAAVTAFLLRHLGRPALDPARAAIFEAGLAQRRKVLGDAWVDRSLAKRNAFNTEFQDLITRHAWGEIWTRPGLDHRTRRLLVLAMTVGMGRWEEFKLHVRAGLEQDGFTVEDLREVIHQAAVYCGVPAGNTAMNEATEVLREIGRLPSSA